MIQRFVMACLLWAPALWAEDFKGTLYEVGSERKKILFTFRHEDAMENGRYKFMKNFFLNPDGTPALTENVEFDEQGELRFLMIDQVQTEERGVLEIKDNRIYFNWTKDKMTRTTSEKLPSNLVVAATLVPYMQKHWEMLLRGEEVEIRFGALDRRETVGFEIKKIEEKKLNGRDVMVVKMKASSFLIAAFVDPLYFTFDKENKRLLEMIGRTAPKIKVGNTWKDTTAEIVFEYAH